MNNPEKKSLPDPKPALAALDQMFAYFTFETKVKSA